MARRHGPPPQRTIRHQGSTLTRQDPDVTYTRRILEDDAAWLAKHANDLHNLAYGPHTGDPDVIVQSHNTNDLSTHIGTPEQDLWRTLLDTCRRIEAIKNGVQRHFNRGKPAEWRPQRRLTRDDEYDAKAALDAARRRRRNPDMYTPTPLNPETGLQ